MPSTLPTVWFGLIAVLWTVYLVLEGFDFGVGMLVRVLGRDEPSRRAVLRSIGPFWDGNEVWLITAGGAMFAAFPLWYATMFSGFYLPLFAVLLALIGRGIALEYRGQRPEPHWRARWDAVLAAGSLVPPLVWGIALTNLVAGVPVDAAGEYVGGLVTIVRPYPLLGGISLLTLALLHGAVFVALKTTSDVGSGAARLARRVGPLALVALAGFVAASQVARPSTWGLVVGVGAVAVLTAGYVANWRGRQGWAFTGTAAAVALWTIGVFVSLFPDVMPTTLATGMSLTVANAASSTYTLKIMSIAAAIFTPLVLLYQGWTYWVFRNRVRVVPESDH